MFCKDASVFILFLIDVLNFCLNFQVLKLYLDGKVVLFNYLHFFKQFTYININLFCVMKYISEPKTLQHLNYIKYNFYIHL